MLKRFARDVAGVAAIEFAFIAPVLITMYFGVAELTQAMIAQRRVSHAASTIGDLVSQGQTIAVGDFADVWIVGQTIVSPFPTAPLNMRISSITANAQLVSKVDWSEGHGMSPLAKASTVTVPASVISVAGDSVIKAEVSYVYTSPVNYILHSPVTFTDTFYFRPRLSNQVVCATC